MSNSRAFYRSIQMRNAVLAILSACASPLLAQLEIDKLGQYKSRGHGGGHQPQAKFSKVYAKMRAQRNQGGQGHPHTREIARRQRCAPPSVPRRLWSAVITVIREPEVQGYVEGPTRESVIRQARRHGINKVQPVRGVAYG